MAASSSGHRRFVVPDDVSEDIPLSGISKNSAANYSLLEMFSNICNVFSSIISLVDLWNFLKIPFWVIMHHRIVYLSVLLITCHLGCYCFNFKSNGIYLGFVLSLKSVSLL
jgi:hypothetical protein